MSHIILYTQMTKQSDSSSCDARQQARSLHQSCAYLTLPVRQRSLHAQYIRLHTPSAWRDAEQGHQRVHRGGLHLLGGMLIIDQALTVAEWSSCDVGVYDAMPLCFVTPAALPTYLCRSAAM